jgi:DNA-directed RNA polymerase subunit K/omega
MVDPVSPHDQQARPEGIDFDPLVWKAGGRFKLVTLIQRRMRDLQRGAPPLIEHPAGNLMQTAIEEYHQDKIWPVQGEEAEKLRKEHSARAPLRPPPGQAAGTSPKAKP